MRRHVAALVVLALCWAGAPAPAGAYEAPPVSPFADVSTGHVFYEQMAWLAQRKISTGYVEPGGATTFRPGQPVLREQMAAFLYRLAGSPEFVAPAVSPFADVPTTHVFYQEMAWLAQRKISTGYVEPGGATTFRPGQPVLREQMAAFLYRLEGSPAFVAPAVSPFADVPTTHVFYQQMAWLADRKISTGYVEPGGATTFRPGQPVLREQMAAFLFRLAGDGLPPPVASGTFQTSRPTIAGQPVSGGTLTVSVPAWTPTPTQQSRQWLRDGAPLTGQTGTSYRVTAADRGTSISVRVTGTRSGYDPAVEVSDPVRIGTIPAVVDVSGTISRDTVWSPDDARVHRVTGDLTVAAGATLTLRPGTVVKVAAGRTWTVVGTLAVEGTPGQGVVITSVRDDAVVGDTNGDGAATAPNAEDWAGISVQSAGVVAMTSARLAYAATAIGAVGTVGAAPTVTLTATTLGQSTRCIDASGPVVGSFTGQVRDCGTGVSADHAFDARHVDWGSASGPFPYGRGVPVEGESVSVHPWTGFVPPARPLVAEPQRASVAAGCSDVVLVGARGSGEFPESPDDGSPAEFTSDETGFGSYNYVIAAKMNEQISALRPGASVAYRAVQYRALQIPSYDPSVTYEAFLGSVFDGADKLTQLIDAEAARCPASRFVLMGTSQGAMVVQLGLTTLDPQHRDRVAGVVLLANPSRVIGSTETLWQAENVEAGAAVRGLAGMWAEFYPGLDVALPTWVAPRAISMCHQGDVFCAFGPGAALYPHLTYSTAELEALAVWQGVRVVEALPRG
ncbi:cutinase family protein [Aeromicrobium alkaliterrae]|uniref:SLH domain-containing protein n=1 Tax=Aeromicrobium alkaliterrae TaxID=302168 RepID=A0ABP4W471_9ACTN